MIETGPDSKSERERRRFFRIDDNLALTVRLLDQANLDDELAGFDERRESICFMNNIDVEKERLAPVKRAIESSYPDVIEYLNYLESRIETLSQVLLSNSKDDDSESVQKVNISAQGIRFNSKHAFGADDLVELHLVLKPSNKRILIIGTVVWCLENPNSQDKEEFAVAVDFTYINEADREVMVRHIQKKQLAA